MEKIFAYNLKAFNNKITFIICQMIIPARTFVPCQPFGHDPFPKVTEAISLGQNLKA